MERKIYERMAKMEGTHWWFRARRQILQTLLKSLPLPHEADILEAGCGTGGNLKMLSAFGTLHAFESDAGARSLAERLDVVKVEKGELPGDIPFGEQVFDCILLLDVLEHLEHDERSLVALRKRLRKGGYMVVTVPAFQWLWSAHDLAHHHKRRYTAPQLRRLAEQAGLEVEFISYFNFLLFPVIAGVRVSKNILRKIFRGRFNEADDLTLPSPPLNDALRQLFALERIMLEERMRFPFGVSIVMLAKKA